jgi:hypothetical protein
MLGSLSAQTDISGGIFADATWTLAGSPYHVVDNIVVFDTYTLTIEPGVLVQVDADKTIEIRNSRLVAIGTSAQPIVFEKAGQDRWSGIKAVGTSTPLWIGNQVQMEHCIGRGAHRFMDLDIAYHTPYNFIACEFSDNYNAIWEGGGGFNMNAYYFDGCDFHDNLVGLQGGSLYTISNCTFENNGTAALGGYWVTGCTFIGNDMALTTGHHADGNTFMGNVVAVEGGWAGSMSFTNNLVVGNGTGVRMGPFYNGSSLFTGNIVCRNTLWNIERYYNVQSNDMADLSGNCFCSDDPLAIEQTIYHAIDDITVGLIVFTPFDSDPGCLDFHIGVPGNASVEVGFYPNPVAGELTVSLPTGLSGQVKLTLLDATGRLVRTMSVPDHVLQWDLSDLPDGTYQALVRTQFGIITRTVIVLH